MDDERPMPVHRLERTEKATRKLPSNHARLRPRSLRQVAAQRQPAATPRPSTVGMMSAAGAAGLGALSIVTYRACMTASSSFYSTFGIRPEEVGVSREDVVGSAVVSEFLCLAVCALLVASFLVVAIADPHRKCKQPRVHNIALTTLMFFTGAAILASALSSTLRRLAAIMLLAAILGFLARRLVSEWKRLNVRMIAELIVGFLLAIPFSLVPLISMEATSTAPIGVRVIVSAGAGLIAYILLMLAPRPLTRTRWWPLRKRDTKYPAQDVLADAHRFWKRVRRSSSAQILSVLCGIVLAGPVALYTWASWSDGQAAAAESALKLGYVDPTTASALFEIGKVRPVMLRSVSKDPEHICGSDKYAASLLGDATSSSWFLLRPLSSARFKVVMLPQSEYTMDLAPSSWARRARETGRSPTAWRTPAC